VWVMSDDEDASKSNLVCNGQTQQWQAVNVTFTSEGAKFDGTSSKMTLENVNFGDLSLGFTLLLRMKRKPKSQQMFLINTQSVSSDCTQGIRLVENPSARSLRFNSFSQFMSPKFLDVANILPSDENQFFNVGVTGIPSSYSLFYNSSFVSPTFISSSGTYKAGDYNFFILGSHCRSGFVTDGTFQSVGIANDKMTEEEINKFFDIIE
jgi:hypothetical protein